MKKRMGWCALVAVALSGCVFDSKVATNGDGTTPAAGANPRLFLMGQNFSSKNAMLEKVSDDSVLTKDLKDWNISDVILAAQGDSLYVLNRKAGTVTGYTDGDMSKVFLDVQLTGPEDDLTSGANPYAVAQVGTKLWVACYGSPFLKAIDIAGQKLVDSIDLSSLAFKGQANPNTVDVHALNGKLVVTVGRLNGWDPGDSSTVLVLDPISKNIEKRMALPWNNPYGISWKGDTLLVACVGKWTTADYSDIMKDGGLALVLPTTGAVKAILSEQTAGANIVDVQAVSATTAFVGFSHADYSTTLAPVSLVDGSVGTTVPGIAAVAGLAWTGKILWVADQNSAKPAVYKLDATGTVLGHLTTSLAPGSLVLLP